MSSTPVSVAVVARNEPQQLLDATLDGLLATSGAHLKEIVLVDDGSDLPVCVKRPLLRLVRNESPLGSSRARRQAASLTTSPVLVSIDAHMSFAPDWLEAMLAHVDTGAILCAAWWDYKLRRALCYGADFDWCGERDYSAGHLPGLSFRHRTKVQPNQAIEVPMLMGACYMMLRSSYDWLGGYSPLFRTWGKLEQDLSSRAWILGLGVKCIPDARVGHYSRKRFPYRVSWEEVEFNQLVTVRTVFEEKTVQAFESLLRPFPEDVKTWAGETDFATVRSEIQSRRAMSDAEFFKRFVPGAPKCLVP